MNSRGGAVLGVELKFFVPLLCSVAMLHDFLLSRAFADPPVEMIQFFKRFCDPMGRIKCAHRFKLEVDPSYSVFSMSI